MAPIPTSDSNPSCTTLADTALWFIREAGLACERVAAKPVINAIHFRRRVGIDAPERLPESRSFGHNQLLADSRVGHIEFQMHRYLEVLG